MSGLDSYLASHKPIPAAGAFSDGQLLGEWRITAFLGKGGSAGLRRSRGVRRCVCLRLPCIAVRLICAYKTPREIIMRGGNKKIIFFQKKHLHLRSVCDNIYQQFTRRMQFCRCRMRIRSQNVGAAEEKPRRKKLCHQ